MSRALPLPQRLNTERLALRTWAPEDAEALRSALAESVEHLQPWIPWATAHAPSTGEARALLEGWIEQRESGQNFIYAIFDRTGVRLLGGIGLYTRVGPGRLEIGYWLRRDASGFGFATEATRELVRVGFAAPGVEALEIHTDPANRASMRIPEKLGFRLLEPPAGRAAHGRPGRGTTVFLLERGGS